MQLCHGSHVSSLPGHHLQSRRYLQHPARMQRPSVQWVVIGLIPFSRRILRLTRMNSGAKDVGRDLDPVNADIDYASEKFEVRAVGKKGFGVVATEPIKRGELLLEEAPLLVFQNQSFDVLFGDLQDILVDEKSFDKWDHSLKETLQSRCNEEVFSKFWDLADTCCENEKTALGIARTNGIGLSADSAGLFLPLSRFNHSCRPNVHNSWQEDKQVQVLRSNCDIDPGQELSISYLSFLSLCAPANERLGEISDRFGFDCACDACSGATKGSDWRRERLSQLCDAFSLESLDALPDASDSTIWLNLRKRMPLYFEVKEHIAAEMEAQASKTPPNSSMDDDIVERMDMRDGLRETTDLLEEEFAGNPAARALVFFGAFRKAVALGRASAAKSLAKATWNATILSEGSTSWRAQQLESLAKDPRVRRKTESPEEAFKKQKEGIWRCRWTLLPMLEVAIWLAVSMLHRLHIL